MQMRFCGGRSGMGGSPCPSLGCARVTTASRCTGFQARRSSARRLSPPRSHRRFHLNRNLFDKNIRPTEMRDGILQGRKKSEGRTVSRLQVVALTGPPVNLGEKSIHPSASVKEEACSFLTSVRAGHREGDDVQRGRESAPSAGEATRPPPFRSWLWVLVDVVAGAIDKEK